ncbi:MAG: Hpt domain-containing protein [Alphaproteobacteria bacterium]|nr:Hpt domain-containing protein [Alphaproteobacteria bacterium]
MAERTVQVTPGVGAGGEAYEIIKVPNTLAAKAGGFRADRVDGREVAALIEKLAQGYPDLVRAEVAQLAPLWAKARSAEGDKRCEQELFRITHDLAGQSTTFGYPLVSAIAGSLRMLIEGGAARRERAYPAVAAHIAALTEVIRLGIKGDGGSAGKQILLSLHAAVVECLPR